MKEKDMRDSRTVGGERLAAYQRALSPEQRKARARHAAKALWAKLDTPELRHAHYLYRSKAIWDPIAQRLRSLGHEWKTTRRAHIQPTMRDLAWAAGFIEGEGSFGRSVIAATQKGVEPLQMLHAFFGGTVREDRKKRGLGAGSKMWNWNAHGARARGIIMTLYPFFTTRRKAQAMKALRFTQA